MKGHIGKFAFYMALILGYSMVLIGCDKKEKEVKQIMYDIPENPWDTMDGKQGIEQSSIEQVDNDNEKIENSVEGQAKINSNKNILVMDNDFWAEVSDFQGVPTGNSNILIGNHPANVEYNSNRYNVFCPDKERNLLYYSNYGSDQYIYQLDGDESTLLVAMKASHLYVHENDLYFIGHEVLDGANRFGSIYRYNLQSKELTLLYEGYVYQMWVTSEGIYLWESTDGPVYCYYISFDTMIREELDVLYCLSYSDYVIYLDQTGLNIRNLDGKQYGALLPTSIIAGPNIMIAKIYNDVLYVSKMEKLYAIHLLTGEKRTYDISRFKDVYTVGSSYEIDGYTFFNEKLYINMQGNSLLEVDLETGEASRKQIKYPFEPNAIIKDIYTDGNRLFATGFRTSLQKEYIYEITLSDELLDYVYHAVAKEIGE